MAWASSSAPEPFKAPEPVIRSAPSDAADRWGWVAALQPAVDAVQVPTVSRANWPLWIEKYCGGDLFDHRGDTVDFVCDEVDPELTDDYKLFMTEDELNAHSLSYATKAGAYVVAAALRPTHWVDL